jgi:hypothetical protein
MWGPNAAEWQLLVITIQKRHKIIPTNVSAMYNLWNGISMQYVYFYNVD